MLDITELREASKKLTLLYAEDDKDIRVSTLEFLSDFFDTIKVAKDGAEALDIFQHNEIDLVITDIQMPIMDGLEMTKYIKESKSDVPILIFTAHNEVDFLLEAITIGVDDYIFKPLNAIQFIRILNKHVRQISIKKEHKIYQENLQRQVQTQLVELREKDKQLMQQSRLAQMGEMISMIAHQWRQPLNSISLTSSNLQLKCMMQDIDADFFDKELKLIDKYSQHLSKTIDDFRGFFKENKTKESSSLKEMVEDTLDIVKTSIDSKNIALNILELCDDSFMTFPNEIKQVVLNILKNAEDALLDTNTQDPTITIESVCSEETKILLISDNAGGIPKDIINKIFDPYFSTKLEKDGTGLGLYMSKTIIEEHCEGKLRVSNDEDGAIFMIEL